MWATIRAGAADRTRGLEILDHEFQAVLDVADKGWAATARQLSASAAVLAKIPLKKPYREIPKISLIGEIYVRFDPISLQNLIERMADRGFIVRTSPSSEWFKYVDWLAKAGIDGRRSTSFWIKHYVKRHFDRQIRKRLAPAGLFHCANADVEPIIEAGKRFVSPWLTGEVILTVGSAFHEMFDPACGIISIGPFGCMPTRVAEAILTEKFNTLEKRTMDNHRGPLADLAILAKDRKLPFLAIETDGNAFPQVIEARLEAFILQAQRVHEMLMNRPRRLTPP